MTPSQLTAQWPEDRRVEYEERAAIMEYDGGLSRSVVEWQAYRLVRDAIEGEKTK